MKDLTFGEQVKIILSRKGMTIKELAEQIQEETGKAMSRQNLTQRLGRDNFQEQDMRMIAKILGCPFRLSIFPTNNEDDFNFDEEALLNYIKKSNKKKKEEQDEDVYQQEFVFDEMMTASVAEMPATSEFEEEPVEEYEEELVEEYEEEPVEEYEEELVEEYEEEPVEEYEELVEEPVEEYEEEYEEEPAEEYEEELVEEPVEAMGESEEAPVEVTEHKQEKFRGGLFFKFGRNKKNKKADKKVDKVYEERPEVEEIKLDVQEEVQPEKPEVEVKEPDFKEDTFESRVEATESEAEVEEKVAAEEDEKEIVAPKEEPLPSQAFIKELEEKFEPIMKPQDENEDLKIGELNPYTGHEYQTNSVRMHPKKIGYVQVYDRTKHGWVNMTEWAFLGYQEKKKKQLGRNYEPPIYLD